MGSINKNKVVLVQPPIQDFYLTRKRTIPYGLASIAGHLSALGFDVDIIDGLATRKTKKIPYPDKFTGLKAFYRQKDISRFSLFYDYFHFGYSYQHIAHLVREAKPFVVGISSLFTAYSDQALLTAQAIKKFHKSGIVVLGGHHPTHFPETVLKSPDVDVVLRGEGELSFSQFCLAVKKGNPFEDIPGICYKKCENTIINKPVWINNLSSLARPRFELVDHKFYQRNKKAAAVVVSSRGCPMPCSYCSVSCTTQFGQYRQRPVEDVIDEIKDQLDQQDIGFLDFEDENLCLKKKWFRALFTRLEPLLKNRNIELRAMNGLYPASLDKENLTLLSNNGFKTLNLSLGASSPAQLKKFQRPDILSDFERVLDLAPGYDLECVSYLIAAAPAQAPESSIEDLVYLASKRTLIGLSIYYPAPGSADYEVCIKNNLLPGDFRLMRSTALPINDLTTRRQAVTLLRLSRITNFMKYLADRFQKLDFKTLGKLPDKRDRVSVNLLVDFFNQGKIKGVDSDGKIYDQNCDTGLIDLFIKRMQGIEICGATTCQKITINEFMADVT